MTSTPAEASSVFTQHLPRLFGIAYRMLGSAADAEDVLQDVWLRWQTTDHSAVASPVAFLSGTTTRMAIDMARSAGVRRQTYVGPWLPEPMNTSAEPAVGGHRGKPPEPAELLVLQALCPIERAAYVLKETFDCDYSEIAEILRLDLDGARKAVDRAHEHVSAERRDRLAAARQD